MLLYFTPLLEFSSRDFEDENPPPPDDDDFGDEVFDEPLPGDFEGILLRLVFFF
jgi:hypothetical protein